VGAEDTRLELKGKGRTMMRRVAATLKAIHFQQPVLSAGVRVPSWLMVRTRQAAVSEA
jgi:hypothetical protein